MSRYILPERIRRSFSQVSSYGQCGKRFELERRAKAPSIPGWWNIGGTAVHATIADWLTQKHEEESRG